MRRQIPGPHRPKDVGREDPDRGEFEERRKTVLGQRKPDRQAVQFLDIDVSPLHPVWPGVRRIAKDTVGEDDIVGGKRRAVVPTYAITKMKGVLTGIWCDVPCLGKVRDHLTLRVGSGETVEQQ